MSHPFVVQAILYVLVTACLVPALAGIQLPMVFSYATHKALHLLGVVLFLGHNTVSMVWMVAMNRTGDASMIRLSVRVFTWADTVFTAFGLLLIVSNGVVMSVNWGGVFGQDWLVATLCVLGASGIPLLFILPGQLRLWRLVTDESVPDSDVLDAVNGSSKVVQGALILLMLGLYYAAFFLMSIKPALWS